MEMRSEYCGRPFIVWIPVTGTWPHIFRSWEIRSWITLSFKLLWKYAYPLIRYTKGIMIESLFSMYFVAQSLTFFNWNCSYRSGFDQSIVATSAWQGGSNHSILADKSDC
jgi:hypothetical protein